MELALAGHGYISGLNKYFEVIDFMCTVPNCAEYQLYSTNDDDGRFVIRVEGQHNQIDRSL